MSKISNLRPRLAEFGQGIRTLQPGSWRANKRSATQRGYTYKWQQARFGFLRSHPQCCYCQRAGRVAAAEVVDHRIPHRGDMVLFWDRNNWQPLCKPCHDGAKKREEAQAR